MSRSEPIRSDADALLVVEEDSHEEERTKVRGWRILVVDDDNDIHEATHFALKGVTILDRPIELLHARSAAEAHELAAKYADIAVALVDVVMETPDAGLRLVQELRDAGHQSLRIVLRTGQPGYAPELAVISKYEIDDYRTKTELTQTRLLTVLTAGIRAYAQTCMIMRSRAGLEMIVESSTKLFQRTNLELFSRGVLTQIAALLRVKPNGIVSVNAPAGDPWADSRIVSAVGRFAPDIGKPLDALSDPEITQLVSRSRGRTEPLLEDGYMALHLSCESGPRTALDYLGAVYDALSAGSDEALTIARIGDGTLALLGDRDAVDDLLVEKVFAKPYRVDGIEIAATATTSIVDLADAEPDPPSILRTASSALLHVAQTQRGKCVTYDASMRAAVERRGVLQVVLKKAVENGEGFSVHVQPKTDLLSDAVGGGEALLRWHHEGETVSPAEFIPIAESAGLTRNLTDFVIHTVGRWARTRRDLEPLPIAINLSMVDLNNLGLTSRLLNQISDAGLSPETVEFEVTEGIAMQNTPWAIEQVRVLKDAGFRIALDDFGTGYSSLGHFKRLPIDILKIDRSFVAPLDIRTARTSLAAIMLAMTQAFDVDCVAEGIETLEQKQPLIFLGCTVGQGYLFGKPIDIEEFADRYLKRTGEPVNADDPRPQSGPHYASV